jgi:hypothetical protein
MLVIDRRWQMIPLACSTALAAVLLTPAAAVHRLAEVPQLRLDAAALALPPSAAPAPVIAAKRKGDSLRNGAIWGAVVGGVYGALGWGQFVEGAATKIAVIAAYTGGGALIGTCIDAMHSRREDPVRRLPFEGKRSVAFRVRF